MPGPAPKIVDDDLDYVLLRAAEGASVNAIRNELEKRGLHCAWVTVNRVIETHTAEIEKLRERMIRTGVNTYMALSTRLLARNDMAHAVRELIDMTIDRAKSGDSQAIKDLRTLIDIWERLVGMIGSEAMEIDPEENASKIAGIIEDLRGEVQQSTLQQIAAKMPGIVISDFGTDNEQEGEGL